MTIVLLRFYFDFIRNLGLPESQIYFAPLMMAADRFQTFLGPFELAARFRRTTCHTESSSLPRRSESSLFLTASLFLAGRSRAVRLLLLHLLPLTLLHGESLPRKALFLAVLSRLVSSALLRLRGKSPPRSSYKFLVIASALFLARNLVEIQQES